MIAASGTLAQLIPPSLVLVVLSSQVGVSVGDLFLRALIPGLILSGLYALYVVGIAFIKPDIAPALPPEARTLRGAALARRSLVALVPPLVLIFAVLGSIFLASPPRPKRGLSGPSGLVSWQR